MVGAEATEYGAEALVVSAEVRPVGREAAHSGGEAGPVSREARMFSFEDEPPESTRPRAPEWP